MTFKYENKKLAQGFTHVIGCDEVGRGCLAGPVVAAAVVLPQIRNSRPEIRKWAEIKDSKQLPPKKRKELSEVVKQNCVAWGIGIVDERKIDEINIHNASLLAMRRAVDSLVSVIPNEVKNLLNVRHHQDVVKGMSSRGQAGENFDVGLGRDGKNKYFLFLDGKFCIPEFNMQQEAVVEGDGKILSVAAASIVAKVFRDELMEKYHEQYPRYNFAQHKGYATFHHRQMVKQYGLSAIHRLSFCAHL